MPPKNLISPINRSLNYLHRWIEARLTFFFDQKEENFPEQSLRPEFSGEDTLFLRFFGEHQLTVEEYLLLLIALAPHVQPQFFDEIIPANIPKAGDFPQLGGTRGKNFRGFLPTGQTALFIIAGTDQEKQRAVMELFSEEHFFARRRILQLETVPEGEPRMSGRVLLSQEYIDQFLLGRVPKPRFSMDFPAELLETEMEWDDLVLSAPTLDQIKELEYWVKHGETLLEVWKMKKWIKPGFRALFHGPPGTGKTLTASLLGKFNRRDVYRVDLSMVISKFIGETEKNLANLFAKAENKDWILFFDEADALFGKRTNVRDAHDKYANQEVAYLLQRIESYNGLVILASNLKSNIDEAFLRRFQSVIHFPMPKAAERLLIWQKAFPEKARLDESVDLEKIVRQYELSGAGIVNVIHSFSLRALGEGKKRISEQDILAALKKELLKEGKIL